MTLAPRLARASSRRAGRDVGIQGSPKSDAWEMRLLFQEVLIRKKNLLAFFSFEQCSVLCSVRVIFFPDSQRLSLLCARTRPIADWRDCVRLLGTAEATASLAWVRGTAFATSKLSSGNTVHH